MTNKEVISCLKYIKSYRADIDSIEPLALDMAIEALKTNTAHWIKTNEGVECSNCMRSFGDNPKGFTSWVKHNLHYCPKCGAKMTEEAT